MVEIYGHFNAFIVYFVYLLQDVSVYGTFIAVIVVVVVVNECLVWVISRNSFSAN